MRVWLVALMMALASSASATDIRVMAAGSLKDAFTAIFADYGKQTGASFAPDIAKYIAYPEAKMDSMGLFTADWAFINPRRPTLLEKYNQVFGG